MTGPTTLIALARAVTVLLPVAMACVLATPVAAADASAQLKDLMGTYLGRASVKDLDTNQTEEREIDVEVTPFKGNGFRLRWVNVTLVDGRRDVPGVKRRVSELAFVPAKGQGFFVAVPESNVFAEREEVTPLGGDALRWAVLDAAGLHLHSFVILDDGRYELQSYTRRRAGPVLDLHYQRVVDGKALRVIEGRAVKVQ